MIARIALVVDIPNWAFHRIAKSIQLYSPEDMVFDIFFADQSDPFSLHKFLDSRYDLIHYYWRLIPLQIQKGKAKITTAIYDHQYLDDQKLNKQILKVVDGIYASSEILKKSYEAKYPLIKTKFFESCPDGVHRELFASSRKYEFNERVPLEVIWVGNSKWGVDDHKGFNTIFKPLAQMIQEGIYADKFRFKVIDASVEKRTFTEMADVYDKADVLLCTSKSEGTPNPVLEASAAGMTWISTPVGIVSELAGPIQHDFIVNRNPEFFLSKLVELNESRELLEAAGKENRENILYWGWDIRTQQHFKFFRNVLFGNSVK